MASSSTPLILIPSSINIDETFGVPHIVRPGETISSSSLNSRPGGKGANVSAALGLSGVESWFAGNVGEDAPWPLDELKKRGVKTDLAGRLQGTPTGRAFIQIAQEDGENSIVLLKGANFPPEPISPNKIWSSLPRKPSHVVLQNEIPLSTTAAFQSYASQQGALTIWNPSPLPTADELKSWKWNELDVLIVNQGEGLDLIASLTGEQRDANEDAEATMERLASIPQLGDGLTWIVMTRGAKGVLASVLLEGKQERKVYSLSATKPKGVKDTTGAGDTFAGYLVSSLALDAAQGANAGQWTKRPSDDDAVKRCLTRAKVAAAMAVETEGAMGSIPSKAEVDERMKAE